MKAKWNITKWCKSITDSGEDEYTGRDVEGCDRRFRLLDDDGVVYAYGKASEETFERLQVCIWLHRNSVQRPKNRKVYNVVVITRTGGTKAERWYI